MNKNIIESENENEEVSDLLDEWWWGELTEKELNTVAKNAEKIIGLLQLQYDYTRERAEEEFNLRMGFSDVG